MLFSGNIEQAPGLLQALSQNKESLEAIQKLCSIAPDRMTYIALKSIEKEKQRHFELVEKLYIEAAASTPVINASGNQYEDTFFDILKSMIFVETELINTYKNIYTSMRNGSRDGIFEILVEEMNNAIKLNWIYCGTKK